MDVINFKIAIEFMTESIHLDLKGICMFCVAQPYLAKHPDPKVYSEF